MSVLKCSMIYVSSCIQFLHNSFSSDRVGIYIYKMVLSVLNNRKNWKRYFRDKCKTKINFTFDWNLAFFRTKLLDKKISSYKMIHYEWYKIILIFKFLDGKWKQKLMAVQYRCHVSSSVSRDQYTALPLVGIQVTWQKYQIV